MNRILALAASLLLLAPASLAGQSGERPLSDTPTGQRATGLLEVLDAPADRRAFLAGSLSSGLREGRSEEEWMSQLEHLSGALADAKRIGVRVARPAEITLAYRTADDETPPHFGASGALTAAQDSETPGPGRRGARGDALVRFLGGAGRYATKSGESREILGRRPRRRQGSIRFHRAYGTGLIQITDNSLSENHPDWTSP